MQVRYQAALHPDRTLKGKLLSRAGAHYSGNKGRLPAVKSAFDVMFKSAGQGATGRSRLASRRAVLSSRKQVRLPELDLPQIRE